jgi:hypothetical protein
MKQLFVLLITVGLSLTIQAQNEKLIVPWPESWIIGSKQKTNTITTVELIPAGEKIDTWSILGTTQTNSSLKGAANSAVEAVMNAAFSEAKKNASNPTLTLIDKKEDGTNPWILFKIEAAGSASDKIPESSLYYVIADGQALYSNFVAIKQTSLSTDFTNRWSGIFKSSQFVKMSP